MAPVPSPGPGSQPIYIPAGPGGVTTILLLEPLPGTGVVVLLQTEVVVVVAAVHSKGHPVPPPYAEEGPTY